MTIPYTFAGATTAIPLAQLDANFASPITLGNVAMTLSNTYTSIGNLTLTNVTVSSGNVAVTNANVTTLTATNDASISGLTVGKGYGSLSQNTVFGVSALSSASLTGNYNTAVGYQAGYSNTTGTRNTFTGKGAGYTNTTGSYNLYAGFNAGYYATGDANVALGDAAYSSVSNSGTNNTTVGQASMGSITTGSYNSALGYQALSNNTTASNNTAVGYQAGYSNTTGTSNTAIGYKALYSNTTGALCTAVGYNALTLSTGARNTAFGEGAGQATTTGQYNLFVGESSAYNNTTGSYNTYVGCTASTNYGCGELMTTGSRNTILGGYNGNQGGLDIRTASNYIVLSDGDGNPRQVIDGSGNAIFGGTTQIGAEQVGISFADVTKNGLGIQVQGSSSGAAFIVFRNSGGSLIGSVTRVTTTNAVAYNTTSDQRLKSNIADANPVLDKLMTVKVRQFDWTDGDLHQDAGFIAQELAPVLSGIVTEGKTEEDMWQLDYSRLTPYLVKAIQELNAKVDAQALEIAQLKGK